MENSENKVYSASKSHCRVGRIIPKKMEEDKSITETDFKTEYLEKHDTDLNYK
ncbi:hypothetical protein [Flavobacterium sp. ZB4P13]|uniref:hypothetical protein n=1 Tax=Flavobacterium sp. ZB4P13 TaxID=3401728 RepID=UPI003AAB6EC0